MIDFTTKKEKLIQPEPCAGLGARIRPQSTIGGNVLYNFAFPIGLIASVSFGQAASIVSSTFVVDNDFVSFCVSVVGSVLTTYFIHRKKK